MMRRIDLLPAAYVQRRRDRRNTSLIILAGGLVILLLLGWYFLLQSDISNAKNDLSALRAQNDQLQAEIDGLQRFAALDAEVKAKQTALQTVFAGDIDWPSLMTEIAMVVPGEVWLSNMQAASLTAGGTAAPVVSSVPLSNKTATGTLSFNGNSASCMPGVAKWLIRLATVVDFDAAWLGNAAEPDSRPGCEPPVIFQSSLQLTEKALSHRFEGELE